MLISSWANIGDSVIDAAAASGRSRTRVGKARKAVTSIDSNSSRVTTRMPHVYAAASIGTTWVNSLGIANDRTDHQADFQVFVQRR